MTDLYQIIELSIAPVFLLTGIGGLLNVMSGRLARVVDRARLVEIARCELEAAQQKIADKELAVLWRRIGLSNWSIGLCTFSGLLVCVLVVCLFSANLAPEPFDLVVEALFITSLLFLIASLTTFMLEIRLATKNLRAGKESRIVGSY